MPDLTIERFIAMAEERGLSVCRYQKDRLAAGTAYVADLIDISKDGKKLATYQTSIVNFFSESDIAKKLDRLQSAIIIPAIALEDLQ